jgi:hypothetical protein
MIIDVEAPATEGHYSVGTTRRVNPVRMKKADWKRNALLAIITAAMLLAGAFTYLVEGTNPETITVNNFSLDIDGDGNPEYIVSMEYIPYRPFPTAPTAEQ